MVRLSRIAVVTLLIAVMSFFLPDLYWKIFEKSTSSSLILYSAVDDCFMLSGDDGHGKRIYKDEHGNTYTRKAYEMKLPFFFFRDLEKWGKYPDTVKGKKASSQIAKKNRQMFRISPKDLHSPEIQLYPLFESNSIFTKLEFPQDMFRITDKIEFIDSKTNEINLKKSKTFTSAMKKSGFVFPACLISGNSTDRKPFDEGYFITDKNRQLFHLKMVSGKPRCKNTGVNFKSGIRYINIEEKMRKEFYGSLITGKGEVYLIGYDNYRMMRLPVDGYNPDIMGLLFVADPLNRNIIYGSKGKRICVLTDRKYNKIRSYVKYGDKCRSGIMKDVQSILFPFSLEFSSGKSRYVPFSMNLNGVLSLVGIFLSVFLYFLIVLKKYGKKSLNRFIPDFIIIIFTGFYGLAALTGAGYLPETGRNNLENK